MVTKWHVKRVQNSGVRLLNVTAITCTAALFCNTIFLRPPPQLTKSKMSRPAHSFIRHHLHRVLSPSSQSTAVRFTLIGAGPLRSLRLHAVRQRPCYYAPRRRLRALPSLYSCVPFVPLSPSPQTIHMPTAQHIRRQGSSTVFPPPNCPPWCSYKK